MPTSWWCLRAIWNFENHHFMAFGVEISGTDIQTIRGSSLGIEGWALCTFGDGDSESKDTKYDSDITFPAFRRHLS